MSETQNAATGTNAIEAAAASLADPKDAETTPTQGDPADDGGDGFKSEESKRAVLADLSKERSLRKELQSKLDKIEAANLTDLERAQKEAKEAQEEAAKARSDAARLRLATRYKLSEEEVADLPDDPEKAERLAARLGERKSDTTTTPKPDLTQGVQQAMPLNGDGLTDALARAVGAR